jgi:hypothetical protein
MKVGLGERTDSFWRAKETGNRVVDSVTMPTTRTTP